jgi:hypothetical protein
MNNMQTLTSLFVTLQATVLQGLGLRSSGRCSAASSAELTRF